MYVKGNVCGIMGVGEYEFVELNTFQVLCCSFKLLQFVQCSYKNQRRFLK